MVAKAARPARSCHAAPWPTGIPTAAVTTLATILAQSEIRAQDLLPIRHGRMAASPWTYFRGAAAVMAADLASTPNTGITVQLCGDAHVLNFGLWNTPERNLSFDLRDFDETLPGPLRMGRQAARRVAGRAGPRLRAAPPSSCAAIGCVRLTAAMPTRAADVRDDAGDRHLVRPVRCRTNCSVIWRRTMPTRSAAQIDSQGAQSAPAAGRRRS